jgi:hypothetical protein
MKIPMWSGSIVPICAVLLGTVAAADAAPVKHSGQITGVDRQGGRIFVAEVGPWRTERGHTVIRVLVVNVTASTKFALVRRATSTVSGVRGRFVEEALEPWDIVSFDPVTIECRHAHGRLIALKITVLAPDMADAED